MATADEILSAELCDDILTVDLNERIIMIPRSVTNIGVESDDSVQILHFRVPRFYCSVDLSKFVIRINYLNANNEGDVYEVEETQISDDGLILFDWIVGRNAVSLRGNVTFNLCFKDVDSIGNVNREFNTTIATLPVLPGLETGEMAIQEYTDILEQWRANLFGSGDTIEQEILDAGDEVLKNISKAVNKYVADHQAELTGPRGATGPQGPQGIKGDKGDKGDTGSSISEIKRISGNGSPGTTDTYMIIMTDGKTHIFHVYNGADGDMMRSTYDPTGRATDIFAYVDNKIGDIDTILDEING